MSNIVESFACYVADALVDAGLDASSASEQARRAISEIEQTMEDEETLVALFEQIGMRLRQAFEAVVGGPVDRILIAPVPRYLESSLPYLIRAIPEVVLGDNFRAGEQICEHQCVNLADALSRPYDAYFLGTVVSHWAKFFRDQFPPGKTVGAWELRCKVHESERDSQTQKVKKLLMQLNNAAAPVIFLSGYVDVTLLPTLLALNDRGRDVFVILRRPLNAAGAIAQDLITNKKLVIIQLSFHEMLSMLNTNSITPVIVNYQRFFPSHWDIKNTLYLFAYTIAILHTSKSRSVLHLYDIYNVCTKGFEWEREAIHLYHLMLMSSGGILVNSDTMGVFDRFESVGKPVLSFLRYAPTIKRIPRIANNELNLVCVTGFLGEHDDPTRATDKALTSLLRRGFHVHYYSNNSLAKRFKLGLREECQARFHLHAPIMDQAALVREISQYDAGWLGIDLQSLNCLERHFSLDFGKKLASVFPSVTCATAALYYGAAGLPVFATAGTYYLKLFGPDSVWPIMLTKEGDIANQEQTFSQIDFAFAKKQVLPERFTIEQHIEKLDRWLQQFSQKKI